MTHDEMQDDLRLNALARTLGAQAAERLDVAATARAVVERLRDAPRASRRRAWVQLAWVRIAAAIVVVVGGGLAVRQTWWGGGPASSTLAAPHGTHLIADDLRDLSTDELRSVLASFDDIVRGDSAVTPAPPADLRQLNTQQLRAVLRSLEG